MWRVPQLGLVPVSVSGRLPVQILGFAPEFDSKAPNSQWLQELAGPPFPKKQKNKSITLDRSACEDKLISDLPVMGGGVLKLKYTFLSRT